MTATCKHHIPAAGLSGHRCAVSLQDRSDRKDVLSDAAHEILAKINHTLV